MVDVWSFFIESKESEKYRNMEKIEITSATPYLAIRASVLCVTKDFWCLRNVSNI